MFRHVAIFDVRDLMQDLSCE